MRLIMKFGGTSVGDGGRIAGVANFISSYVKQGHQIVVVTSALAGVTDDLIEACNKAAKGDRDYVLSFMGKLREKHREAYNSSIASEAIRNQVAGKIEETILELENVLTGISYLREVTPRIKDYVLSFGERLSTPIVCGALKATGVNSQWFTGGNAGIVTNLNFGNARPLMEVTVHHVKNILGNMLEANVTPVVAGFIAADQNGIATTLGRGGSDNTATILGLALDADEVWILSDVDGIMTTDPKIEPKAKTIPQVSFPEAIEMAYFGAKKLHPTAIEIVMEKGIPIRLKNSFNPENPGTLIVKEQKVEAGSIVKSISLIRKAALITVAGASMVGAPGAAARIFEILGRKNINILMISQSSSEANISFVIPRNDFEDALNILETSLLGGNLVREIRSEDDICIIALVGAGMVGTPGVAARIFSTVAKENINIRMIAQGSSELNISFAVNEKDGEKAVRALHREFGLDKRG